jgi:photosystem II stability/assembly factor-like uncharacterized protein
MRKQFLLISAFVFLIGSSALVLSRQTGASLGSFVLETEKGKSDAHKDKARLAADAAKWRMDRLKDENGNFSPAYVMNALWQADNYKSVSRSSGLGLQWQEMGPDDVGGRTRAILIDKRDSTNNTLYAGGVSGGMWKSTDGAVTWQRLTGWNQWLAISCIAQAPAPDYTIFIGTGEGLSQPGGSSFNSGSFGDGIFKLDANDNPLSLTPTIYTNGLYDPPADAPWAFVNRLAINPTNPNQILAATAAGLYESTSHGDSGTWNKVTFPTGLTTYETEPVGDVKWSSDGKNIFAACGYNTSTNTIVYSNNGGITWAVQTSASNAGFPTGSNGRIELAIAPTNPNYVYALMATTSTCTKGVYKSTNAGHTWSSVAVAGPLFQLFEEGGGASCQGWYDNIIAVSSGDPNDIYMGGVNFYTASDSSGITAADVGYSNESNPYYMHPDKHAIVIADNNPDLMFVGCDGGIFKSIDALSDFPNPTYTVRNRGYNVTQNYGIGAGVMGDVIGGSQDNGTNYIGFYGNDPMASSQVLGGDGGLNGVSQVDPDYWFGAIYFAALYRSSDHTATWGGYFDVKIDPQGQGGASVCGGNTVDGDAQFITPYYLGETENAVGGLKVDSFTATQKYNSGDQIQAISSTAKFPFNVTLSQNLDSGQTIAVSDPIRSRIFLSTDCGVFLTSDALNITIIPRWFKLTQSVNGQAQSFVTTADGNNLYFGTDGGIVYRFTNLNAHADTATYPAGTSVGILYQTNSPDKSSATVASGRSIEGIAVDPTNNNHVVAVVAGFSASPTEPHVYESKDGGTTWTGLTTGLPDMPVYSVVIHDANTIIIGTEFGVWSWTGSSWNEENSTFERVPVYRMIERPLYSGGCNVLYLGSHGRGMWRCTTLTPTTCQTSVGTGINNVKPDAITGLSIFPNPIHTTGKVSLNIDQSAKVTLRVFDMTGKLYSETNYQDVPVGTNYFDLNTSGLSSGSYLLAATLADEKTISKLFVVAR